MYSALPLTLALLLLNIVPSDANIFPRTSQAIGGAATRVHRIALRHSARFARDLREVLGVLVQPASDMGTSSRVYCVGKKPGAGGVGPSSGGHHNGTAPTSTSRSPAAGATATPSPWQLVESHEGTNFFSGWNFFEGNDPTGGYVTFVGQGTAQSSGLAAVNPQGHAIMAIDTTPQVQNPRHGVRITSLSHYDGGLFIMDSVHMPTGCGTWPAWWTNGPNWPVTGEIDIIEGVNTYTNNQATIHATSGCSMPSSSSSALGITGTVVGGTDCSTADTGNEGCGVRASQNNSFGAAFNSNGGGVYAMKWDTTGISAFFFPRESVPADITAGTPQPSSWGSPMASWPSSSCNSFQYFKSHSMIFDTTLCGDWAGSVWTGSGTPGQAQSCAQMTGFSTCEAYVQANGGAFSEAYWEVASVKVYQLKS